MVQYRRKYRNRISAYNKRYHTSYYTEHREAISCRMKRYYRQNKAIRAKYNKCYRKERIKSSITFKIACRLRTRLYHALHRYLSGSKVVSAVYDCGCSITELLRYLEAQFQPGMSWDNWGNAPGCWSIDHIKPLSQFNLANKEQALQAIHYTNLQPMWHTANMSKGAA